MASLPMKNYPPTFKSSNVSNYRQPSVHYQWDIPIFASLMIKYKKINKARFLILETFKYMYNSFLITKSALLLSHKTLSYTGNRVIHRGLAGYPCIIVDAFVKREKKIEKFCACYKSNQDWFITLSSFISLNITRLN